MQVEDITIEFRPVPEGTTWEVLIQHEVRTLYRVLVPHAELGHTDTPKQDGLAEAVEARALELLHQQCDSEQIGELVQATRVLFWAPTGRADTVRALEYHGREFRGGSDQD